MSEPAKRIYVYPEFTHKVTERHETDIEYVRADIVEEMREAFLELIRYANDSNDCQYGTLSTGLVKEIAQEALKRLEEE